MDDLDVLDWRERTAALYLSDDDLAGFRAARDELFRTHPASPLPGHDRAGFPGLDWFPPDPAAVVEAPLHPASGTESIDTGGPDGVVHYRRLAVADTPWGPLTLWWIEAYGGGLFVPVRDGTSGRETYGGGRYLTDTVKGTFGRGLTLLPGRRVLLDANYLYNPSCAYDDTWACPLAPPENRVDTPIRAGERNYSRHHR
ncbi:DUF1684 domain-containing protein [Micromonospora rifamycinica]|uniref:DUF1684 domain-containing protein n=1 Tax=Micromonospora rifamycinica TaxID=291594 RepID=UPI002E2B88ED|nr:DUF1684 domain-containing protein [Micromonospora rifamycinica]